MKYAHLQREESRSEPGNGDARKRRTRASVVGPLSISDVRPPVLRLEHSSGSSPAVTSAVAQDVPRSPDQQLATARQGTSGSGGRLPHFADIQRSFGRHDVGNVSAHQGSRAAAAARVIGARAYTTGDRVAFAAAPDLHTAAHEAAHVVQQRAGVHLSSAVGEAGDSHERHAETVADQVVRGQSAEALLDQVAPAGSRSLAVQRQVVQRAISTNFGEFDTTTYKKLGPSGHEYGVDIEITFDPDPTKVNAKKIGLVQTVRVNLGGTNTGWYPLERRRMVPSGTGAGAQIDTLSSGPYGNPLYVAGSPAATDKLGDTPVVPSWGQHGWHYTDTSGVHHQIAKFNDSPSAPGRGNNSSQTFETTALAVEGTQSGTYMGSVSWGWRVDGSGTFTKLPFSRVSKGKPSAGFIAAATQWNTIKDFGNVRTKVDPTNVYDATYHVAFTVAKHTPVSLAGTARIDANLVYDDVTILSGPHSGSPGRIKMNDLEDTGGSNPVIKLPIPP